MERNTITNYIGSNKDRMLNELLDLLRIPSVSADTKYKDDVLKTADAVFMAKRSLIQKNQQLLFTVITTCNLPIH
jgi:hypothetical protein